ncbi:hypothetical protein H5410_036246 [Solanum commersonii]|uniref:Uncharacterized protein n=1 Tax=Solanum commersonii TaxID=4109 RepID=A0A9J5Y7L4_SOLCO|nr:hypothetical protein H5410_036246 [Solanum commersonii]
MRGEASFEKLVIKGLPILMVVADLLCFRHLFVLKFWGISLVSGEAFGDSSEGKRSGTVSWSTRGRLSGRLWLSLVRLSMFRHLFIDLLEYGGVRVLSMLNFYSSCLRPYFGKMLDYDSMSLDIIE